MTRRLPITVSRWLSAALLLATAGRAWAQRMMVPDVEPRWLRLDVPETSVGVDIEGLMEDQTLHGITSTHENLTVIPLVGAKVLGSIYHPNLLSFDFTGLGGLGWATDTVKSPGYNLTRNESQNLLTYIANVNLLSSKPYNASFFATQDHNYNNYDFYNTMTVDSTRYGGHLAWNPEHFTLSADMGYRDQVSSGITGVTEVQETYLNFNGLNQRQSGSSTLTYSYEDFNNTVNYGPVQSSLGQSVGISDTEIFGSRAQISATTGGSYGQVNYLDQNGQRFNLTENVVDHLRPNLDSYLHLNYDNSDLGTYAASQFQGIAGVRHQLYESLTSTLDLHGNYSEFSSTGNSALDTRYGSGLFESYTKSLGGWGRLSLGGSVVADHLDQEISGRGALPVLAEPHVLSDTTPTSLKHPLVVEISIVVTGPGGVPLYVKGDDYRVFRTGEVTQIQRIPTSASLPNNSPVLVSYEYLAPASSSYYSINSAAQIRLDLLNTFGLYARYNVVNNNAPPTAMAETLNDFVGGADITWRWFRAGAEYEDYDSSYTQYRVKRLFEEFNFRLGDISNLGINFNQVWYNYGNGDDQTQYQFRLMFDTQVSSWLFWTVQGGYYIQDAFGASQDLAAASTGLTLNWGKLSARLGYQYNYQLTTANESMLRNFFYVRLNRVF
jgi:hypothetical protein